MMNQLIAYSIKNKAVVGMSVLALVIWGLFSLKQIPIDAVPDITNNQVQIITTSPNLATQEVEQSITAPLELALQNLQDLEEIRSISRFGLSVITVVFKESTDIYLARQLVNERLTQAREAIPENLGTPELAPISTGLGEIYQYVVRPKDGYQKQFDHSELRTIQDWIVKRQLSGIEGVIEVNSFGGYLKQYEVAVSPNRLNAMHLNVNDVLHALEKSNANTGGSYIEKNPNTYYIRSEGLVASKEDIEKIVITTVDNIPVLIRDVAKVQLGHAPRYGALTRNGEEVVGGIVMMLKGENAAAVTARIKERVVQVQKSLPEGVVIEPFLVRDKLVDTAINTVTNNLIEGGLIVIFILVLLLGNWRAGLIVASVIPLAMLFAIAMMNVLGISANLMSLGAIDFGLIIDGAVIIVEAIVHQLQSKHAGKKLSKEEMNGEVLDASQKIRTSAAFGEIIILMVYIPILALVGIEGKMFKPMAQTVALAIVGALILSLTYVPMMTSLFLSKNISNKRTLADKIMTWCYNKYKPLLDKALQFKKAVIVSVIAIFGVCLFLFSRMGGEFIPTLEEGDFALHQILPPGSSLTQSVEISKLIQNKLKSEFPEVEDVITKIGSAEIPTDPMPVETGDIIVVMKPKSEWTSASTKQEMFHKMEDSLKEIPGVAYEFSQPIQMRFNELMTGSRADIAIKLYGDDLDLMYKKAKEAEGVIKQIGGVGTVKVEQTVGMPQLIVKFNYDKLAQYGLQVKAVNNIIQTAYAGQKAGVIYEGERRFDLMVRFDKPHRNDINKVQNLLIPLPNGHQVSLSQIATIRIEEAPMQISRDNTNRRIVIGVNVGSGDVERLVEKIQATLDRDINLPSGYYFTYGGQFENLKQAKARLGIAVPIALGLIFFLLYITFRSASQAVLIFTAIPLSAIGGVLALLLRGLPFSISAGIGFIALFGVAVLNGIVLIGYFNRLKKQGMENTLERIIEGTKVRLRPVLMTAAVASFGFLPMAISTSGGAEVQRPLATVVIGGLLSATFLTLFVLPILYLWLEEFKAKNTLKLRLRKTTIITLLIGLSSTMAIAQEQVLSQEEALQIALNNHPGIASANLRLTKENKLSNLGYSLGATQLIYEADGSLDDKVSEGMVVGLMQNLPNPLVAPARNKVQRQIAKQANYLQQAKINEISSAVIQSYQQLLAQKTLLASYKEVLDHYTLFSRIATNRFKVGMTTSIEKFQVEGKVTEFTLLKEQCQLAITNLNKQLQQTLVLEEAVRIADSTITPLAIPQNVTANDLPNVQVKAANITLAQAQTKLLKRQRLPSLNLGVTAKQHTLSNDWGAGLRGSLQLSLFDGYGKKKVKAQQQSVAIAIHDLKASTLSTNNQLEQLFTAMASYQKGIELYQKLAEDNAKEAVRVAALNYQSGSITYLEFLNVLSTYMRYKQQYISQVLNYNLTVTKIKYYNGN